MAGCLAVGAAALLLGLVNFALVGYPTPHIHDEFSYLLGADTFASGRLANPTHPLWVYFETMHVNHQPTYVSMYHPAQALVMAAGQKLGHPWYGVLASAVVMCMTICWMLQAWIPSRWALLGGLISVLMTAFSYWVSSYWGGAVAATGGALLVGSFGRIRRHPTTALAVVMAAGVAILANSRPYEGGVLSLVVLIALFAWSRSPQAPPFKRQLRQLYLPVAAVLVLTGSAMMFYFWRTTGNPLKMPYAVNLETYIYRRMWLWGKTKPEIQYRHEMMRKVYRELLREKLTWTQRTKAKATNVLAFYFGRSLAGLLLFVPWIALQDRRFRPLLWFGAATAGAVAMSEWVHAHYVAPITGLLVALPVQALRHLRTWDLAGFAVGKLAAATILVGCVYIMTVRANLAIGRSLEPDWGRERVNLLASLGASGEKHLILVRYADSHNPHAEWVYNTADIDASTVVWAREMSDNRPLLNYFRDRRAWLLEPDREPLRLMPYEQQLNASIP